MLSCLQTVWVLLCVLHTVSAKVCVTEGSYCQFNTKGAYPHAGVCHGTEISCSCDTDWDRHACGDKPPLPEDPSYDHQTQTYQATHRPVTVAAPSNLTVMPYFSPETSSSTMVDLIDSATESLHIGTPGSL